MSRLFLSLLLVVFVFSGCSIDRARDHATGIVESDLTPEMSEVSPGVWMHTTYRHVEGFGDVRSNGLVVVSEDEAVLVDAAWSEDPDGSTRALLDFVRERTGADVARAVVTHFHNDSVEGIGILESRQIPTYATLITTELLGPSGGAIPDSVLAPGDPAVWRLPVGSHEIEVYYAGPGHTVDNVVVYVPHAGVLYGGCLIRPGESESLGNTADADLARWDETVSLVRERYAGRLDAVVPSHGAPGGPELLDHTIRLVRAHDAQD
jgi:metallo-beta-lactamase class B